MDNELGIEERLMVEAFVKEYPELKAELNLLSQYKLTPDTAIIFDNKEVLMYASVSETITLSNYDEWLMLYMDNELTESQNSTVEQFITAHPAIRLEFALLKRTKLQPEEILFDHKSSLYREEEKVRPMPVRWWRITAAAVLLLGIGSATAVIINNKRSIEKEAIVKSIDPEVKMKTKLPVVVPQNTNNPTNESVADNNETGTTPDQKQVVINPLSNKEKKPQIKNELPVLIAPPVRNEVVVIKNKDKKSNDLPSPVFNPNLLKNETSNNTIAGNNVSNEIIKSKNSLTNPVVTTQNPSSSDIEFASDNKTALKELEQPDGKKNKNRGIFRKIARTFEKRTDIDPTDDNRLLVAGLSIRLK